jgi:uncharacterized integral membrane protein
MQLRNVALLIVLGAVAVFAALNWRVIMAPTALSLGFAEVQAPLGLVLLGMLAVLTAIFLLYLVYLQTGVLLETRRHARELQAQRELADQAEASRFSELRTLLEAKIDQLDRDLRASIEQSGNSLSAYIGELGDRLDKNRPSQ